MFSASGYVKLQSRMLILAWTQLTEEPVLNETYIERHPVFQVLNDTYIERHQVFHIGSERYRFTALFPHTYKMLLKTGPPTDQYTRLFDTVDI